MMQAIFISMFNTRGETSKTDFVWRISFSKTVFFLLLISNTRWSLKLPSQISTATVLPYGARLKARLESVTKSQGFFSLIPRAFGWSFLIWVGDLAPRA